MYYKTENYITNMLNFRCWFEKAYVKYCI